MKRRKAKRLPPRPTFVDPNGQEWADVKAAMSGYQSQEYACQQMAQFDRQPPMTRHLASVSGNIDVARQLIGRGIRTAEEAEPIVRAMLECMGRNG